MTIVNWTGSSGATYGFYLYDLSTAFYDVPGVYIFCRQVEVDGLARYQALYVGEAQSLENRLNTGRAGHDGFKRAWQSGVTHIAARVVSGGNAERLRIETDLRHGLNPSCNAEENALVNALLRQ